MNLKYISDFNIYQRRKSATVHIDDVPLGSDHPLRIQSMTNTLTADVESTVSQVMQIYAVGADYVRITVPSVTDIENLKKILHQLRENKCKVPVIADIHFNAKLALLAAPLVQKVRINPGNYAIAANRGTDDEASMKEVKSRVVELIETCRRYHTAIRIGTNHGSLSSRIVDLYGDTPLGMAESVMEFLRLCVEVNFHEVVVSIKASNTRIMVYATRLLVAKMAQEHMHFPVHLGVTEAGEGEDGRIKSAVGIGALLADGIGDTIRVSLTEDPVAEIPVASFLAECIASRENHSSIPDFGKVPVDLYSYQRRITDAVAGIGGNNVPVVIFYAPSEKVPELFSGDNTPDVLVYSNPNRLREYPDARSLASFGGDLKNDHIMPVYNWQGYEPALYNPKMITVLASSVDEDFAGYVKNDPGAIIILESDNKNMYADFRAAIFRLINAGIKNPLIIRLPINESEREKFQIAAATEIGGLFIDGLCDGLWLESTAGLPDKDVLSTAFGILQATRVRMSKTEYISCPSCGRTLFDIQDTIKKVKEHTSHLRKLKIGIMGCIVNGPGEMADADYGYIGSGRGKITLYKGRQIIKKNVPETEAVSELVKIIKEHGDWVDP